MLEAGVVPELHTSPTLIVDRVALVTCSCTVTSRLDAAEGVHTRGERQAAARSEVEHVVGSRGKALGSGAATQGHVLAATCHGRKLARSATAHGGFRYTPDGGVAATVKDIGVDVELAPAPLPRLTNAPETDVPSANWTLRPSRKSPSGPLALRSACEVEAFRKRPISMTVISRSSEPASGRPQAGPR